MKQTNSPIIESENTHAYVNKIITRIKNALNAKSISQKDLAENLKVATATISKLLAGQGVLNLKMVYAICQFLDIRIDSLLSDELNIFDDPQALADSITQVPADSFGYDQEFLITNPQRKAFRGITTEKDECYFFYTKPTISNEKQGFLKGKLYLTPSEDKRSCPARLELKTGKKDRDNQDIVKEYLGSLVISLPTKSCYINLTSEACSDMAFLVFSHMFLNNEKLLTRLAGCLTTSAGGNRRPVFTKALISRVELNDKQLNEIAGQLYINNSIISIRRDVLESQDDQSMIEQLKKIEHIKSEDLPYIQYYNIEENAIRSCTSLSSEEKLNLINKLRFISSSPYYCKVSSRSDELLFDYISNLEVLNNSNSQE